MAATTATSRRPFETFRRAYGGSNGRQASSETNIGIPFHGSCSRCHHFHINHPFTLSLDSTVHTRLYCERCNHPLFGLGRVSTQNTLASVESGSTFTPRACVDRPGQQQQQPALHMESGTSGLGLLTTIAERRTPAPSRSTSNFRTPMRTPSAASLAGEEADGNIRRGESVENRAVPRSTGRESPEEQVLRPQTATLTRLRTIGRRFKRRFYAKPRAWRLPRIGLQISYAPRSATTGHPSASASTTEVSSGQEPSDNTEQPPSGTGDDAEDRHAPLRARRRELTLARERAFSLFPKCECNPECACNSGSRIVQIDEAEMSESIHVPGYLFGHRHSSTGSSNSQPSQNGAQGLDLLHIGDHFDSTPRPSSADESSSAADSGPRRIRLSQGSTLWSNGSSISLRARRPPIGRASSMPVGVRTQYLPGVRTSSQNASLTPGSGCLEASRAAASLDRGSMLGRTNHTEFSRNREILPHESSTSLENLSDHEEEEQLVNGVSPTSHTPTGDGDEVTPTPHSGIRLDGDTDGVFPLGSDGLPSALRDHTNRYVTDHEIHLPEPPANDRSE